MRADRLVAVLLLLQRRGQVTAAEVATELEVSPRTARRDLDALGQAGLPVYSVQGRNGGWRLLGDGRTDLSGLNAAEVRALFSVAGTHVAATQELRAALRKLVRALPEPLRLDAEAISDATIVEQAGWGRRPPESDHARPPLLDAVQDAVIRATALELSYVRADGTGSTRTVHPLGLAAKGALWYLVANTAEGLRTFRVDRMTGATPSPAPFERPDGFVLDDAWKLISDEIRERRLPYRARALLQPDADRVAQWVLGDALRLGPPHSDGRLEVELRGTSARSLAGVIAGFGALFDVLEPEDLRRRLAEIGAQLTGRYGNDSRFGASPGLEDQVSCRDDAVR